MQPRHRTFVHVSDVYASPVPESIPLQARHIHGFAHQPMRSQPVRLQFPDHHMTFFLLKWLSGQSLFVSVKLSLFLYFLTPSTFFWFLVVHLFFVVYISFVYLFFFLFLLGIFLVVIWFLTVLFFIDSEFVFLWFWPENLFFVQVISLGFFFLLLLCNIM
jgi:hypothetical protein